MEENEIMNSHDVVSLFTKVPIQKATYWQPVSVVMSDMFMEHLMEETIDTAPPDTRPKILRWYMYIDDSFDVVHSDK